MKLIIDIADNYVDDFKLQLSLLGSEDLESIGPSGVAKVAIANGKPFIHCKDCKFFIPLDYSDNGRCDLFHLNPTPN